MEPSASAGVLNSDFDRCKPKQCATVKRKQRSFAKLLVLGCLSLVGCNWFLPHIVLILQVKLAESMCLFLPQYPQYIAEILLLFEACS